ncbi:MAG: rubrerythrin [Firmicutes bacterium]|nr:rubrerythrin [Bacillota bacterium]
MEILFNDLEGLRIAVDIETRGQEFYRQASSYAEKAEYKNLFLMLMNEEIQHKETFMNLYNKIKDQKEAFADDYLFDSEVSRYLTVLAESHVFSEPDKAARKIAELNTIGAILEVAIQAEKDSILFYDELARNAKFEEAIKIFNLLKQEEQGHVVKLRKIMDGLA